MPSRLASIQVWRLVSRWFFGQRQAERERRAFGRAADKPDPTSVRVYDLLAEVEAKADQPNVPRRPRGDVFVEWLEDVRLPLERDPDSVIGDRNNRLIVL